MGPEEPQALRVRFRAVAQDLQGLVQLEQVLVQVSLGLFLREPQGPSQLSGQAAVGAQPVARVEQDAVPAGAIQSAPALGLLLQEAARAPQVGGSGPRPGATATLEATVPFGGQPVPADPVFVSLLQERPIGRDTGRD